jgi:hypothetical protein
MIPLLDGSEKRVHVDMKDYPRHHVSLHRHT